MMQSPFLIVGLGNPGKKFKYTRHNFGFMVVDDIATLKKVKFRKYNQFLSAEISSGDGRRILLLKPLTYMNLSGEAVLSAVNNYNIDLSKLLVITDDINLKFGKLRIRGKGSDGGHNGLKSIIAHLQTDQFPRLRIGVGSTSKKDFNTVQFVLSKFSWRERRKLKAVIREAATCSLHFMKYGLMDTMNRYN